MDTCMHSADLEQKLIKRVLLTATDNPMLQIAVRDDSKAGASPANPSGTSTLTTAPYKTIQIAAAGSSGGNVIVYLNIGASSASYKQYQFSYSGVSADKFSPGYDLFPVALFTFRRRYAHGLNFRGTLQSQYIQIGFNLRRFPGNYFKLAFCRRQPANLHAVHFHRIGIYGRIPGHRPFTFPGFIRRIIY